MSFLFKIPKYPLLSLLSLWLATNDIGNIDKALCNKNQRTILLDLLSCTGFSLKGVFKCKPSDKFQCFMVWLSSRRIQLEMFHFDIDRKTKKNDLLFYKDALSVDNSKVVLLKVDFCLRNLVENDKVIRFTNSEVEEEFLSLINSCGHLKSLHLSNVCDATLLKVDTSVFDSLTSLVLRDQFLDEHFHVAVNKCIRHMLTSKAMTFLSQVCRTLLHLQIECESFAVDHSDTVWKVRYGSKDLAKLIRSNPSLTKIHIGLKKDALCLTGPELTLALAETCIQLRELTVMDSHKTHLLHMMDIITRNPQLARLKLHEPNHEMRKEMGFTHSPKKGRLPEYMHEYIEGKICKTVSIDHLGTTGEEPLGDFEVIFPGQTPRKRKDVHKLHTFFSRVKGLHQVTLVSLSLKNSRLDRDVEWSSDVTDGELRLIARNNPALTDLQLNGCGEVFTADVFHTIFLLCPLLRHLDIGNADHLGCADLLAIFSVSNALHRAYITGHSTFTMECALQIAAQCPCLVLLGVERCILPEEGETRAAGGCVVRVSDRRKDYTFEEFMREFREGKGFGKEHGMKA